MQNTEPHIRNALRRELTFKALEKKNYVVARWLADDYLLSADGNEQHKAYYLRNVFGEAERHDAPVELIL